MVFEETKLSGVWLIKPERIEDERGFFARSFCKKEFIKYGLQDDFVQCNISFNHKKGTLRGLHFQATPFEEMKVVTCNRGVIYDVIVDIRKKSPTFGEWLGIELSAEAHQAIYIPTGFAHGFQTLSDKAEVFYLMGNYYEPKAAQGIRFDDPFLNISWPIQTMVISKQDRTFPNLDL